MRQALLQASMQLKQCNKILRKFRDGDRNEWQECYVLLFSEDNAHWVAVFTDRSTSNAFISTDTIPLPFLSQESAATLSEALRTGKPAQTAAQLQSVADIIALADVTELQSTTKSSKSKSKSKNDSMQYLLVVSHTSAGQSRRVKLACKSDRQRSEWLSDIEHYRIAASEQQPPPSPLPSPSQSVSPSASPLPSPSASASPLPSPSASASPLPLLSPLPPVEDLQAFDVQLLCIPDACPAELQLQMRVNAYYKLSMQDDCLVLSKPVGFGQKWPVVVKWHIKHIRKFSKPNLSNCEMFMFECGRRCDTGEGEVRFNTPDASKLYECVIACMMKIKREIIETATAVQPNDSCRLRAASVPVPTEDAPEPPRKNGPQTKSKEKTTIDDFYCNGNIVSNEATSLSSSSATGSNTTDDRKKSKKSESFGPPPPSRQTKSTNQPSNHSFSGSRVTAKEAEASAPALPPRNVVLPLSQTRSTNASSYKQDTTLDDVQTNTVYEIAAPPSSVVKNRGDGANKLQGNNNYQPNGIEQVEESETNTVYGIDLPPPPRSVVMNRSNGVTKTGLSGASKLQSNNNYQPNGIKQVEESETNTVYEIAEPPPSSVVMNRSGRTASLRSAASGLPANGDDKASRSSEENDVYLVPRSSEEPQSSSNLSADSRTTDEEEVYEDDEFALHGMPPTNVYEPLYKNSTDETVSNAARTSSASIYVDPYFNHTVITDGENDCPKDESSVQASRLDDSCDKKAVLKTPVDSAGNASRFSKMRAVTKKLRKGFASLSFDQKHDHDHDDSKPSAMDSDLPPLPPQRST